jgi:hypothetical protein
MGLGLGVIVQGLGVLKFQTRQFYKNIGTVSEDLETIVHKIEVTSSDKQVAKIEGDLQKEKDDRKSERFFLVFTGILLFDALVFPGMSWAGIFGMLVLEIIFLVLFGTWCGQDQVYQVAINVLDRVPRIGRKTDQ